MLLSPAPQAPATPTTPDTPLASISPHYSPIVVTPCSAISRSSSQQNVDTDSGKSSCSPALLDCSFDSGFGVEGNDMELKCKLKDYKRILQVLEKDKEVYRLLRERLSKIVDRKAKKQLKEEISCNVCCAEIDTENPKSFVTCSACEKTICREAKCSNRLPDSAKWECQACHSSKESLAQTSSWVAEQLSFNQHKFVYPMRARSEIYIPINDQHDSSMHFESVSQVGGSASTTALGGVAAATISNEQKLKIREYVEEVVAQMLGGSLDSVAVGQISKSESYLPALVNGHQPNNGAIVARSNDFADLSQTRLRQLIETIIAETLRLPLALSSSGAVSEVAFDTHSNSGGNAVTLRNGDVRRHRTEHYFEPKIYQDLLATAVLNKIADTHGNAGHLSESSPQFIANDVNQNYHENQSISSSSSIEPRSDCSFTDTDQIINLSKGDDFSPCGSNSNLKADVISKLQFDAGRESALSDYIAAHMVPLPDLSTPATESEEDDYLSVTSSQMAERNWEDNWLFKKKKPTLNTTVSAGNIGMLVPAPKEDVRAQIGDKIADEISDLSEMGSDSDDSSLDLLRGQLDPLNNRLLNKHLIGGQNTKMVLDELIDRSSMISSTSPTENEPIYTETKNKHVISPTTNTEAINTTVTSSLLQSSPPNSVATESGDSPSKSVILPPPCKFDDTTNGEVTLEADAAIPITDQLSSDSNNTDESVKTTVENFGDERAAKIQKLSHDEFTSSTLINLDPVHITNNHSCPKNAHNNLTMSTTTTNINKSSYVITNGSIAGDYKSTACSEKPLIHANEAEEELEHVDEDDLFVLRRFVPGSIAEREYKKWYNAVDMPNNPYAPDALKRRISGSQEKFIDLPNISPSTEQNPITLMESTSAAATSAIEEREQSQERDYKRYSRDYYINDVKAQQHEASKKTHNTAHSNSQESVDMIINEAEIANKTATTTPNEHIYKALPAQVVEDPASLETQSTLSNQSIQSVNTTTSDESDTIRIYDFNKQETTVVIRESNTAAAVAVQQMCTASTQSTSLESNLETPDLVNAGKKERPTDLAIAGDSSGVAVTSPTPCTPSRGSTPTAFKFLQPKRRLIDPSQVMSFDEEDVPPTTSVERKPIEDEVAHVLPSVKALAQAFLMTSHKSSNVMGTRRWPMKIKKATLEAQKNTTTTLQPKLLEASPASIEIGEDATIASDLSSLETDPLSQNEAIESTDPNADPSAAGTSPVPVRSGFLRSNIAFFENLKFK